MKRSITVLAILTVFAFMFALFGCSDDKGTSSKTKQMNNQQAAALISSNLQQMGTQSLAAAFGQATGYWGDTYEPPYVGKVAVPESEWYEYENGWHIYHFDTTAAEVDDYGATDVNLRLEDSLKFSANNTAYEDWDDDIDRLEERSHAAVTGSVSGEDYDAAYQISAYVKSILQVTSNDYLNLNLTEKFAVTITISGASEESEVSNGKFSYSYSTSTTNLLFSPDDDYMCPVSGTVSMTIAVSMTDNSGTYTASGNVTMTLAGGDIEGTITVGDYSEDFTDEIDCGYAKSPIEAYMSMAKSLSR